MTGFAQCKKCKNIYRFPITDTRSTKTEIVIVIPPCPKCGHTESIIDDGGFLINGLNPDGMFEN